MEVNSSYENDMENHKATELRLGLPGTEVSPPVAAAPETPRGNKRTLLESIEQQTSRSPAVKAQIVGWPPVRTFRKKSFQGKKTAESESAGGGGHFVKVSMDGAPYLRKIDLNAYSSYTGLKAALEKMFKCFSFSDEVSELKGQDGSKYAITYEDKVGDMMMVGDIPYEMFIDSCKRLRIMKGSEARGFSSSAP